MGQDSGGPACGRCGGAVEVGEVTAGAGLIVGLGPWGKLGWISLYRVVSDRHRAAKVGAVADL